MSPVQFQEANCVFGPPPDMTEDQVCSIPAFRGQITGGSIDGSQIVVVAWKPDARDIQRMQAGLPVYLAMIGGLAPHVLGTNFAEVTNPA